MQCSDAMRACVIECLHMRVFVCNASDDVWGDVRDVSNLINNSSCVVSKSGREIIKIIKKRTSR